MPYKPIHTLEELKTYLTSATHVAFDFETAPDAHKSHIVGISFGCVARVKGGCFAPIGFADTLRP